MVAFLGKSIKNFLRSGAVWTGILLAPYGTFSAITGVLDEHVFKDGKIGQEAKHIRAKARMGSDLTKYELQIMAQSYEHQRRMATGLSGTFVGLGLIFLGVSGSKYDLSAQQQKPRPQTPTPISKPVFETIPEKKKTHRKRVRQVKKLEG